MASICFFFIYFSTFYLFSSCLSTKTWFSFFVSLCCLETFLMLAIVLRILSWTILALVHPGPAISSKSFCSFLMILSSFFSSSCSLLASYDCFTELSGFLLRLSSSTWNFSMNWLWMRIEFSWYSSARSWAVFLRSMTGTRILSATGSGSICCST